MPKVLVADDNEEMLETLERIFLFYKFEVEKASNGKQAIEVAEKVHPDLILLDGMMPVMDGFEACKILKSRSETRDIPIVFLTAEYIKANDRVAGLELGADDYLLKPFNSRELVTRVKSILRRNEVLRLLKSENEQLTDKNQKIQDEIQTVLEKSHGSEGDKVYDALTGLYNLNFFERRLIEEFNRSVRHGSDLSLVLVRLNHLDRINETLGQQLSNYILIKIANTLLNKTRASDVLARSSDDHFYILLPETDRHGGKLEAERIRVVLTNSTFLDEEMGETLGVTRRHLNEIQHISVNIGLATLDADNISEHAAKDLLGFAKQALKTSVSKGENQTVAYEHEE